MKLFLAKEIETGTQLKEQLEREGFIVEHDALFSSVSEKVELWEYDCILLDHALLGQNLLKFIERIQSLNSTEGVILLTTAISIEERVKAWDLGIDDLIMLPIDFSEMTARIRAVIRRKRFQSKSKVYFGNLVIDVFSKTVKVWNEEINFTRKEFELLLFLISNKNKVISKTALAEYLWGESADQLDTFYALFTHIKNLRKKLKDAKAEVEFKSIYGVGYQIVEI